MHNTIMGSLRIVHFKDASPAAATGFRNWLVLKILVEFLEEFHIEPRLFVDTDWN